MIIRPGKTADASALSVFATRTFYQTYAWYNTEENMRNYVQTYFSERQLTEELLHPDTHYLIAEENGIIQGYLKLGKSGTQPLLKNESHSEIERIYVDASTQRKGIGRQLIQEVINLARKRNNHSIWLGVWQKNDKAVGFYKKIGFEIFGTTQFILGDDVQDDYLMKLDLSKKI